MGRMSSQTCSVPSFFICARILPVTTSRGCSSSQKRLKFLSSSTAPSPRTLSEMRNRLPRSFV